VSTKKDKRCSLTMKAANQGSAYHLLVNAQADALSGG